jgi:tetratricopeptide (TPR) repeat protein
MFAKDVKGLRDKYKKKPADAEALLAFVEALRAEEKHDQAMSFVERHLAEHPDEYKVLIKQGEILIDLESYPSAADVFRRASIIYPTAEAHYNLARALDLSGMYSEAIREHNKATEVEPDCAEAYFRLGKTYVRNDKYDEGLTAYKKCLKYDQSCAKAHSEMALIYDKKGKKDNAMHELKKAIEKDPVNAQWHCNLGAISAWPTRARGFMTRP